jgi:hypothetical protein
MQAERWMRSVARISMTMIAAIFIGLWLVSSPVATRTTAQTADVVITEGLVAWRKPDAQGAACANCHGPDGFELARFNISDDDIRRRDAIHVPPQDSDKIVAMIHAVRDKYNLNGRLLDPVNDRPLQPGGQPIPGADSRERDYNTALQTFAAKLPTLSTGRVDSTLKALQARDEILAFDTRAERIGVPFPRLSEDIFHGQARGLMNDWFSELARVPKPGSAAQWYSLHDDYLANPTEANLWTIYNAVDDLTATVPTTNTNKWITAKYQSLLLGQHLLREEALGQNTLASRKPIAFLEVPATAGAKTEINNPMFAVGSHSHQNRPAAADFPALVLNSLNAPVNDQLDQMMLPWWYLAWTFNTGLPDIANRHEYFPQSVEGHLGGESYPIHHQYVHFKMDMTNAYVPYVRNAGQPPQAGRLSLGDAARGFDYADKDVPKKFFNESHRQLYRAFSANVRRTQLYLLLNELDKQCADARPYVSLVGDEVNFVEGLRDALLPDLTRAEPSFVAENTALADEVIRRLQEAWNRCQPLPAPDAGLGLFAEHFGDINLGAPLGTRIDPRLDFFYTPMVAKTGPGVSIRWTGEIEPRFSESYELSVMSGQQTDSGFRLWVDGQLLIDNWEGQLLKGKVIGWGGSRHFGADVALQAGKRHVFRLEYRERGTRQSVQLMWQSARQIPEVIPQSQLFPGKGLGQKVYLPAARR